MNTYTTMTELDAAFARGEQCFLYAPGNRVEPTPKEAPYQPGDTVYLVKLNTSSGGIPTDLINKPLTVLACTRAPVDDAVVWDLDLARPDGTEVEYLIMDDDVVRTKPF